MSMPATTHFNLKKPEYTDDSDVKDLNDNMDTIDAALWALKNWGSANAGKFLVVGSDGNVELLDVANASGGEF
jgi:hypothetical protein